MKSKIKIYDNYLSLDYFKYLQEIFLSRDTNLTWVYHDMVINEDNTNLNEFQFVHTFYNHNVPMSQFYNELGMILEKLNPLSIIRIKANLLPRTTDHIEHGMHTDVLGSNCEKLKTAILYMNTNNGYTLFEDGTKVNSVENRMVIFPTEIQHTGSTCTDQKVRIVINFNYFDW